jgi:uncharacterized protein
VIQLECQVARGVLSRLRGLAFIDRDDAPSGLLIPRCSSIHTFGMRFAIDVYFLDRRGQVISVRRAVPPRRFIRQPRAAAVLELPVQQGRTWDSSHL